MWKRVVGAVALGLAVACGGGGSGEPSGPGTPPPVTVASVTIEPGSATVLVGATATFTATVRDATGSALSGRAVTWSSGNTSVVTVNSSGVITAVAAGGPVTISATSEGKTGTAQVTVLPPVASITLTPTTATLLTDSSLTMSATLRDANNNVITGRAVTWSTGDPSIATVSPAGVVTAVAPGGPVTITASAEGKSATAQLTVLAPVASVIVTPTSIALTVGQVSPLVATLRDAQGRTLAGRAVSWSTSNPAIASVSTAGLVTAAASGGPVTITATSEGKTGTAQVTVLEPVASVTMSGAQSVKVGDAYTYTATARLADGTIVVRPVTWSVTDPTRGTMSAGGTLVPLAKGSITIVAMIDGTAWQGTTTAYDWESFGSGSSVGVYLYADTRITNKFGRSEYPTLAFGCSGGLFLAYVDTDYFVTQSGLVAYAFDFGTPITQTWLEFDLFSALGHPGPSQATRTFANVVAASRSFSFAFTEFNSTSKAMLFRVTGLGPKIASWLTACPAASSIASGAGAEGLTSLERLQAATGRVTASSAERKFREELRAAMASATPAHALRTVNPTSRMEVMMRPR